MRSMTGYGRGECSRDGYRIAIEVSSVNRKQGEISLGLPRELEPLESRVRDAIHERFSRGRLNVRIALHLGDAAWSHRVHINVALARVYARELQRLAREANLSDTVSLDVLARAPGVFQVDPEWDDAEAFWPAVEVALGKALRALVRMREREGRHLARELRRRVANLRAAVVRVRRIAPGVMERYRDQLRERVRSAGLELPALEDERLLKELVYFADRSDITEELARLESHFGQFDECLRSTEPVGRTLDFLAQEINREVNTIGAKANDVRLSREVVLLKTELEKFREQVQNVE